MMKTRTHAQETKAFTQYCPGAGVLWGSLCTFNDVAIHSEHLGRFRGKLASDVLELLTAKWHPPYIVLDVVSALLLTFALRHIFRQNCFESSLYFRRARIFRIYFVYNINKFVLSLKIFLGVGTVVTK